MITKVTKESSKLYRALFDKAEIYLNGKEAFENYDPANAEGYTAIRSLDEYFAVLKDLTTGESADGDSADEYHLFKILPLDEPTFDIDANTRDIAVPEVFRKNGVGVQGDQLAETLFFTIDRFFETVDLYRDDIQGIIQWETAAKGKQFETGWSPIAFKDVTIVKGKMIFGWFLNNTITSNPGSVKFSVRFFSTISEKDEANNTTLKLDFSLSTKTQTININPAITYDINDSSGLPEVNQYNDLYLVANRFENSKYFGEAESAAEPVFVPVKGGIFANEEQFFGQFTDVNGTIYHLADLNESGELELSTEAISEDAGKISYYWYEKGFNEPTGHNIKNSDLNYVLTPDLQVEEEDTYFIKTIVNGVPSFEEAKDLVPGENFPEGEYYEQFNGITVKNAGDFWVEARNRHGVASASIKSDIVRVPGPKEVELWTTPTTGNFLDENGVVSLFATGTTEQEGDIIKYAWADLTSQTSWEPESDINAGFDADGDSQNIPNEWNNTDNPVAPEEMPYFDRNIEVTVWAERNGLSSEEKKQVMRVTGEPCAPIVEPVSNNISVKYGHNAGLELNTFFKVNKEDEREFVVGTVKYQWFKAVSEEGEEVLENDILLTDNEAIQGSTTNKLTLKGAAPDPEFGVFYCRVTHELNGGEITVFSDKINVSRY